MSDSVIYIGEQLLGYGFALSGARVLTPPATREAVWDTFQQVKDDADLILISEDYIALLGSRLERFRQQVNIPPVLSIPPAGKEKTLVRETIKTARASLGLS